MIKSKLAILWLTMCFTITSFASTETRTEIDIKKDFIVDVVSLCWIAHYVDESMREGWGFYPYEHIYYGNFILKNFDMWKYLQSCRLDFRLRMCRYLNFGYAKRLSGENSSRRSNPFGIIGTCEEVAAKNNELKTEFNRLLWASYRVSPLQELTKAETREEFEHRLSENIKSLHITILEELNTRLSSKQIDDLSFQFMGISRQILKRNVFLDFTFPGKLQPTYLKILGDLSSSFAEMRARFFP